MNIRTHAMLAMVALIALAPAAVFALAPYNQDFEALDKNDTTALELDGWLVFGNVSTATGTYLYGYGPFVAPNDGFAFCQIDSGQGGVDQGQQQLVVFSDYNNTDHGVGNLIESNVFQEQTVAAEDVGQIWIFAFDAKLGNIEGASTAAAFIKTLDPANGYALTNFITEDMTNTPVEWQGYTLAITIDAGLVGQILQIGFVNVASNYEGSGIFYDNLAWYVGGETSVPDAIAAADLRQNHPNPFNPSTRIDFSLERSDVVSLAVYDLAGRRVALLHQGPLAGGEHHVVWNGVDDAGAPVATGQYRYVLTTSSGSVARSMVLLK